MDVEGPTPGAEHLAPVPPSIGVMHGAVGDFDAGTQRVRCGGLVPGQTEAASAERDLRRGRFHGVRFYELGGSRPCVITSVCQGELRTLTATRSGPAADRKSTRLNSSHLGI